MGLHQVSWWSMALGVWPKAFSGCSKPLYLDSSLLQSGSYLSYQSQANLRGHKPYRDRMAGLVLTGSVS